MRFGGRETSNMIDRQMAIDAVSNWLYDGDDKRSVDQLLSELPSAQPDGIPLEWINKHLEWLDNCDNDFAQLAKVSIRAMVELWKKDRI